MRGWKVVSRVDQRTFRSRFVRLGGHLRYYFVGSQTDSETPLFFFDYNFTAQQFLEWGLPPDQPHALLHVETIGETQEMFRVAQNPLRYDEFWRNPRAQVEWPQEELFQPPPHTFACRRLMVLDIAWEGNVPAVGSEIGPLMTEIERKMAKLKADTDYNIYLPFIRT